jgi:hypothetical protein
MTRRSVTTLLWLLAGISLAFRLPSPAGASCNTIPPGPVPFRGARGTIDRPFVRAGDDITLTAACGSKPLPDAKDARVTIVSKLSSQSPLELSPKNVPGGLQFKVPPTFGSAGGFAGPVALAVTSAVEPPAQAPLSELAAKRCRDFQRDDLFVCVDELFTSDGGACGTDPHPDFAAVTALPTQNDFQKMCTPKDNDLDPRCTGAAGDRYPVSYTLDTSGNVLLNISWGKILAKPGSNQLSRRSVQGSVLEAVLNNTGPSIDIPSEAFLDSFNTVGLSFSPKPLFRPGVPPEPTVTAGQRVAPGRTATAGPAATPTPKEVAFYGRADQNESVLRIARRKLWDHACSVPVPTPVQACEQSSDCPGGAACAATSARYFVCNQGGRDKLPCTRPQDCPGGICSHAYCVNQSPGRTPTPCTTDHDCGGQECGPGLFNLRGNLNNGIGTIPRDQYRGQAGRFE